MSATLLSHGLLLSLLLFAIGVVGVFLRRNAITVLMSIELMLNAANISLIAFSRFVAPALLTGQVFAIFVMVVAAAEVAVGLAIILAIYRGLADIDVNNINLMKW